MIFVASCAILAFLIIVGDGPEKVSTSVRQAKFMMRHLNPVSVFLWYIPKNTAIALWWGMLETWDIARDLPSILLFLGRIFGEFFRTLFTLIHSEERIVCMLYAAVGSAVGYFTGDAIVGALVGGTLGVFASEIGARRRKALVPV